MSDLNDTAAQWLRSRDCIMQFLRDLGIEETALEHNAGAIIARLAQLDPPMLIVNAEEVETEEDIDESKLRRIASAMFDGIDGHDIAPADSKELHRLYKAERDADPAKSFTECGILARVAFMRAVLTGEQAC